MAYPASRTEQDIIDWVWNYYNTALNLHDMTIVDEIGQNFRSCENNLWEIEGPDGIKNSMGRMVAAFDKVKIDINDYFVKQHQTCMFGDEIDLVTIWWTISGTFIKPLMGIAPTDQHVSFNGCSYLYIKGNELLSAKALSNIYQVLGQLPEPQQP